MNYEIGQLLDNRYELMEVIGTGGMAVVYKAKCHRLNRFVAVKILKDEFSGDEEFRKRFRAEGEAVAMLAHPNIVQVFDVSATDNANFIVMELIDGISLKQYMEVKGVLNWKETLHFASQIAKGLEHAHSRGIVHRDIKPHNVMVLKNGSVKVMDFGIAQVMNKSSTLTKEALGSVHYISPEQAKGSFTDNRSDIYSLGVVMYEMMAGRPPYDGESPVSVAIQHINGGAPLPSLFNQNIPAGLEQCIMHCMALEAKDRYANATELLQDLEEIRKNPAIAFPYPLMQNTAPKPLPNISGKPQNMAERAAKIKGGTTTGGTGNLKVRTGTGTIRQRTTGAVQQPQPPVRDQDAVKRAIQRRKEEERLREERSRVATIAIIICSFVAIVAIIVFLWAIFNGAVLSQDGELVEVPRLIGEMYSDALQLRYPELNIRSQPMQYSNDFAKGQIMHQEPSGGEKVSKGADLFLTVSMGEEPAAKVMMDLRGVMLEEAKSFLTSQGYQSVVVEEISTEQQKGLVLRTEPAEGEPLVEGHPIRLHVGKGPEIQLAKMPNVVGMDIETAMQILHDLKFMDVTATSVKNDAPKGQVVEQSEEKHTEIDVTTKIILKVSEGPEIQMARMPNVLGMDEDTAVQTLHALGFHNVSIERVESNKPKGQVVRQSHYSQTELDVTTQIQLEVSKGAPETEPPATQPAQPEPTQPTNVSLRVTFVLPLRSEPYTLSIFQNGHEIVSNVTIPAGETSFAIDLTGYGTVEYDLFINGDFYQTQKVPFTYD